MIKTRFAALTLALTGLLAPATSAFALPVAAGASFDAKVENVKAYAGGSFSVNFDRMMCNIDVAPGDDDDFAVVSATAAGRDTILSVAISALLAGKTVRVFATDPASGNCTIDSLMVLK